MPSRLARTLPLLAAVALLAASACSGGSDKSADDAATASGGHPCDQGASMDDVKTHAVMGSDNDRTLTSFDGTALRIHWFPLEGASKVQPVPTVLMGPGWSLAGDSNPEGGGLFSPITIEDLWAKGYNVLTWDPRGFGKSEGVATVNDPEHEGRDVQALLDFVAEQPEAQVDAPGDPRAGMAGFSYGGSIQLAAATMDCRIDAIVPGLAWHSLESSLYKAQIAKTGWANLLTRTVPEEKVDPHVISARDSGLATGSISDEDVEWFTSRGPGDDVAKIDIPTLLIGGTVDTLFTLDEDLTNYALLHDAGVPVSMLWFCGGHGTCLTDPGAPERIGEATSAWLARYLLGDEKTDTGPALDLIDQDGEVWTADAWPVETIDPVVAEGSGTLPLTDAVRSGGVTPAAGSTDPMAGVVASVTPAPADGALEVPIETGELDALAIGAPKLELSYSGTVPDGDAPVRVFAQLVDEKRGVVVGNQITPIALTLDGTPQTTSVDLEVIAQHLQPGQGLTLQLVPTTSAYATPRLGGEVTFDEIKISIPVATEGALGVTPS